MKRVGGKYLRAKKRISTKAKDRAVDALIDILVGLFLMLVENLLDS